MYFHYIQSAWLVIALAMVAVLYAWSNWNRRRELARLGEWRLVKALLSVEALQRRKTKDLLALAGLVFIFFAALGPQFGTKLKEVKQKGVDVFIAVDTSRSMLAEDVAPSRLERAKRALSFLISKLEGNRIGLIAFAKYAVLQCPLTVDTDAARMYLDVLDENTVPAQGTAIGDAIRLAVQTFPKDEKTGKAVVLLTDGEDHRSDPDGAAALAKENGVVIFTIGIGTPQGDVIKKKDENGKVIEFLKHDGEMVMSRMDDALLSKISALTGGRFYRASSTDQEIDEIAQILNDFDKKEFSSKIFEQHEERYQPFALIGLLLLLLDFFFAEKPRQFARIKTKTAALKLKWMAVAFLLLLPHSLFGAAKEHIIEGNKLLKKGDLKGARMEFESAQIDAPEEAFIPYNIATTYLLEGNFDEAKRLYAQADGMTKNPDLKAKIAYNLGHVSFYEGNRPEAINHFKECLKLTPNDLDAKYNIEYIRAGKTPKEPPPQSQNKDQKNGGGDSKDKKQGDDKKNDPSQQKNQSDQKQSDAKENAERVLQMMEEQEKEKMKNAKPVQMGESKPDKKNESTEDW
jgi:Ca-activated chloride channel family protein